MKFWKSPLFFLSLCLVMACIGNMYKVMIPANIYDALQTDMGFSATEMASLGYIYMLFMAISQIAVGIFINKLGSLRAILIGGLCFAIGGLLFPLTSRLPLMQLSRAFSSIGVGILFLGITAIITDLFPQRFTSLLSIYLIVSYCGAPVSTLLIPWFTHLFGWRLAILIPACIYLVIFITGMILHPRLTPAEADKTPKLSIAASLKQILGSTDIWRIFASSSLLFGCYYAMLALMGAKSLTDTGVMSNHSAQLLMTFLAFIPMIHNIFTSRLDKVMQKNYPLSLRGYCLLTIIGSLLGLLGFIMPSLHLLIPLAFLLISIPAGGFAIYSNMCRLQLPQNCVALAVALLNCAAFVMISAVNYLTGRIMLHFEAAAEKTAHAIIYPSATYQAIFLTYGLIGLLALLATINLYKNKKANIL